MRNLKEELNNAKRILVTSHRNCDQDGITSALATKLIIEKNFKKKKVQVNIESELQENISFLKDFSKIKTEKLVEYTIKFNPDFIIFTDGQTPARFSHESEKMLDLIEKRNIKTAIIDHHGSETTLKTNYIFNNLRSSCAEEIYHTFVQILGLKIDKDIAEIILTGMIFDTGVFTHQNNHFRETANIVADLVDYGAVIEIILNHKNKSTENDIRIIAELSKNLSIRDGFCYSYFDDDFFEKEIKNNGITEADFKKGRHLWMDFFLKNIEGCEWGFVLYQTGKPNKYKGAARSVQGGKIVREFAEKFGGGGHDHASGFPIEAKTVKIAIDKILAEI